MFDLPSLENVIKVVVDENTIASDAPPLLIYADQPKVAAAPRIDVLRRAPAAGFA